MSPNVLVVDDQPRIHEVLRAHPDAEDFVVEAATGAAGVQAGEADA